MTTPLPDEKPQKVCIYLPIPNARAAKAQAATDGQSLSDWVNEAIEFKLSGGNTVAPGGALATEKRSTTPANGKASSRPKRR